MRTHTPCSRFFNVPFPLFLLLFRVSQRLRVLGSLVVIMVMFIVTAVIVRVPLDPLPFFCVTMVKIVIINGVCSPF